MPRSSCEIRLKIKLFQTTSIGIPLQVHNRTRWSSLRNQIQLFIWRQLKVSLPENCGQYLYRECVSLFPTRWTENAISQLVCSITKKKKNLRKLQYSNKTNIGTRQSNRRVVLPLNLCDVFCVVSTLLYEQTMQHDCKTFPILFNRVRWQGQRDNRQVCCGDEITATSFYFECFPRNSSSTEFRLVRKKIQIQSKRCIKEGFARIDMILLLMVLWKL